MHSNSHVLSGGRYPVLRAVAILYLIGAAVTVVAEVVGIIYILARGPGNFTDRVILSIGTVVAAFFLVVALLAIAEVLKLFIDIEHNTRMHAAGHLNAPATMAVTAAALDAPVGAAPAGVAEVGHTNRLNDLAEESAEAALIRGH
jgi:hypothetical protein